MLQITKRLDMVVIFLLGIASGLPLALSSSTLGLMLLDCGVNISKITVFGLASTPYAFKYLWAPLIDSLRIPVLSLKLGRRCAWLFLVQVLLLVAIISTGKYASADANLFLLGAMAFSIAFFSATQDIIIDAYRIDMLADKNQGVGAAVSTFGYRVGMLISAAGSMVLAEYFGWSFAYFAVSLFLIPGAVAALLYGEPYCSQEIIQTFQSTKEWAKHIFYGPIIDFIKHKNWFNAILLILSYKLGDAFIGVLTSPFLVELGFSKIEIATIIKIYGFLATLCGMFVAGYWMTKFCNIKLMLCLGLFIQCLSNLSFIVQNYYGHDAGVLIIVISVENFCSGLSNAALVAYISTLVKKEFSATQYAVLSSLAVFGRTTISTTAGFVASALGWTNFFAFSVLLSLPACVCLYYLCYEKS